LHQAEVRVADETESERHRRNSESVGVETERLDELVLAIYGWRFKEFVDELFFMPIIKVSRQAKEKGLSQGAALRKDSRVMPRSADVLPLLSKESGHSTLGMLSKKNKTEKPFGNLPVSF
jgi:hypothetical protein